MLFNSIQYLMFFPVVTLLYFVIPKKVRYLWLLASSYFFYMCWNAKYGLLILFSTFVTWLGGIALDRLNRKGGEGKGIAGRKKAVAAICLLLNLGLLF